MKKLNVDWRYLGISVVEYMFNTLMTFATYVVIGLVILYTLIRLSHFDLSFLELGFNFNVKESDMKFFSAVFLLGVLIFIGHWFRGKESDEVDAKPPSPPEEGKS